MLLTGGLAVLGWTADTGFGPPLERGGPTGGNGLCERDPFAETIGFLLIVALA